jgi:L-idonate 5-dehydrogenase
MSSTMSCVVHGPGDLRVEPVEIGDLAPNRVRIAVAFGGICGSDLHYATEGRNGDYEIREPLTLGHEISGRIVELGPEVRAGHALTPGMPVTIHPATPCPRLGSRAGEHLNRFRGGSYLGSAATTPHTQGGFTELLDVRPEQIRPLPPHLPLPRAALAEPTAIALHAVGMLDAATPGSVLVSGAGPIGLLTILALRAQGVHEIIATDLEPRALERATRIGATTTMCVEKDAPVPPASVDAVIEASGAVPAVKSAIAAVADGGTVVLLGIPARGDLPVPLTEIQAREITVRGAWRFDIELDQAIQLLSANPVSEEIITHVYPLRQAADAFQTARSPANSSKVLLRMGDME